VRTKAKVEDNDVFADDGVSLLSVSTDSVMVDQDGQFEKRTRREKEEDLGVKNRFYQNDAKSCL
jgi:hypothetical protein